MKEKLYTIPLNEAFDKKSECPFCALYEELEKRALEYTMGPSYMEPDVRIKTNEKGFCKEHYDRMYKMKNRLGLALMISSHIDEIMKNYESFYNNKIFQEKKGFFSSKKVSNDGHIKNLENSCFVCEKISSDMDKFFDTFIFMWRKDSGFKDKVLNSNAFCLKHFDSIVNLAYQKMSAGEFESFYKILFEKQKTDLVRVKDDLDWFIQKFDYRFKDEPWKNSKDALMRSIIKVASKNPEKDNG